MRQDRKVTQRGASQGAKRNSSLISAKEMVPECGFDSWVTPTTKWRVLRIGMRADPRKTDEWATEKANRMGPQKFAMEFGLQWGVSSNLPFFPEYLIRGGDETFVRHITGIGKGPLLAGLDFGERRPVILVGQTNLKRTQLIIMREWAPLGITGPAFAEVCGWLCHWFPLSMVSAEGLRHVNMLQEAAAKGEIPPVPWVTWDPPSSHRWSGHEALRPAAEVASASLERTTAAIWEARGMPLSVGSFSVEASALVVRHLLRTPPPLAKLPYLVIGDQCPLLIRAFNGGYTFARATKANPHPTKPFKDGVYDNVVDALRYLVAGVMDPKLTDDGAQDEGNLVGVVRPGTGRPLYSRDDAGQEEATGVGFSSGIEESTRRVYERGGW